MQDTCSEENVRLRLVCRKSETVQTEPAATAVAATDGPLDAVELSLSASMQLTGDRLTLPATFLGDTYDMSAVSRARNQIPAAAACVMAGRRRGRYKISILFFFIFLFSIYYAYVQVEQLVQTGRYNSIGRRPTIEFRRGKGSNDARRLHRTFASRTSYVSARSAYSRYVVVRILKTGTGGVGGGGCGGGGGARAR